jgi:hypothetical protein
MNLISPFWPQTSGLFRWTGIYWLTRGGVGATPGQYEGWNYLGAGALLLTAISVLWSPRGIGAALRRHAALVAVLFVLCVWAVSNRMYFGAYLLLAYEPPQALSSTVLAWFRTCGRMFWPVGWLLVAIGVARAPGLFRPRTALALAAVAILLQWIDTAPWRHSFAQLQSGQATAFGTLPEAARVARAIAAADSVAVIPPVFCSSAAADYNAPQNVAALEVQLMAARANVRMSAVYLSRAPRQCGREQALGPRGVLVMLNGEAPSPVSLSSPGEPACFDVALARICTYGPPG